MTNNQKAALESAIDKLKGYWEADELHDLLADGGKGEAVAWLYERDIDGPKHSRYVQLLAPEEPDRIAHAGFTVTPLVPQAECAPREDYQSAMDILLNIRAHGGGIDEAIAMLSVCADGGKGEAVAYLVETFDDDLCPVNGLRFSLSEAQQFCWYYANGLTRRKQGAITPLGRITAPQAECAPRETHPTDEQVERAFMSEAIWTEHLGYAIDLKVFKELALKLYVAPTPEREAQPVATLHDDGHWVWKGTPPHESNYAGWRMEVYAHPIASADELIDGGSK